MNKSISKEELNELPVSAFMGKIVLVEQESDVKKAIHFLNNQQRLGFDTETRPTFKKGRMNKVALLQLSTDDTAFLFRLNKMGLSKDLTGVLSNPCIVKTGVAIKDDLKDLRALTDFEPAGFVELQEKVKEFEIENFGLKKLSGLLLGFRISKAQQTSNWEAEQLTEAQLKYAATDAWVSLGIYNKLIEIEQNIE